MSLLVGDLINGNGRTDKKTPDFYGGLIKCAMELLNVCGKGEWCLAKNRGKSHHMSGWLMNKFYEKS